MQYSLKFKIVCNLFGFLEKEKFILLLKNFFCLIIHFMQIEIKYQYFIFIL